MYSAIIPTKDRPDDLRKIVESLLKQTVKPAEIIIIDQSISNDIKILSSEEGVVIKHFICPEITGLTNAKNRGVREASGDIIFFFDDDIICDTDFCERILDHFTEAPQFFGICGRQNNSKSSRFKVVMFSLFHRGAFKDNRKKCNSGYEMKSLVKVNILPGGITAYRREVFNDYQFDETLIKYCLGEDMDFSYRVSRKYELAFATDAQALHNHSQIGRYDALESYACKITGYDYFYKKNLTPTFANRISYTLVKLGIAADALHYTLAHKNLDAVKGFIKGKQYIRNNYYGVPFIDAEKLKGNKSLSYDHYTDIQ